MRLVPIYVLLAVMALGTDASAQRSAPSAIIVLPGHTGSNGDISVTNDPDSGGQAKIQPGGHNNPDSTSTTVQTYNHFVGAITSTEAGDVVTIGNNNTAWVSGIGGVVNVLQSGSTVTVSCTGGAGATITVQTPTGPETVQSGQTVTFTT